MEKAKDIAGISCRVDKLNSLTYEILFDLALRNIKWKGVKDKEILIDKELRENGFKPIRKTKKQAQSDNSRKRKKKVSRGNKKGA